MKGGFCGEPRPAEPIHPKEDPMPHHHPIERRSLVTLIAASASCAGACLAGCSDSSAPERDTAGSLSDEGARTASFRNTDLGCDLGAAQPIELDAARNFTLDRLEDGEVLICTAGDERFLVVDAPWSAPDGLAEDIELIRRPLTSVYLVSTGMICLLDEIDALDSVSVCSVTADDSPNERLAEKIRAGKIAYGGKYRSPDFELIAEAGCTLAIENTKINHAPDAKRKLQDLDVAVLTEQSSSEPEVLGRLEWIKLMGVLFDREDAAQAAYGDIAERVRGIASLEPTGKTVAFFYINEDGAAVTRRSTDYFSQMIDMAGGTFVAFDPDDEEDGSSSVQSVIDLETFYATAKDADVIIYNTTVDTAVTDIDDILDKNPLLADMAAARSGEVYACDENMYQAMNATDEILEDIRSALEESRPANGYLWKLA